MPKYAIQELMLYGWDYIGTNDDGTRTLFDTLEEAEEDMQIDLTELNHMSKETHDWKVVEYDASKDSLFTESQ